VTVSRSVPTSGYVDWMFCPFFFASSFPFPPFSVCALVEQQMAVPSLFRSGRISPGSPPNFNPPPGRLSDIHRVIPVLAFFLRRAVSFSLISGDSISFSFSLVPTLRSAMDPFFPLPFLLFCVTCARPKTFPLYFPCPFFLISASSANGTGLFPNLAPSPNLSLVFPYGPV